LLTQPILLVSSRPSKLPPLLGDKIYKMPLSEETKEKWAEAEKRYAEMHKKREKKRQAAAEKEIENELRRKQKAEKQRVAAAAAAASKARPPPPPPVRTDPILTRRREMLNRMGLSVDNPVEIKKAWKRLALQYHPDKCGSDTKFKTILEAYEFLMQ
jgi:hypothetical protein